MALKAEKYKNPNGEPVEAIQYEEENALYVAQWCNGDWRYDFVECGQGFNVLQTLEVPTFYGDTLKAFDGDFVVRNEEGIFFPMPEESFYRWFVHADDYEELYVEVDA